MSSVANNGSRETNLFLRDLTSDCIASDTVALSSVVSDSVDPISVVGTCRLAGCSNEVETCAFSISLESPLFSRVAAKRKESFFRLS